MRDLLQHLAQQGPGLALEDKTQSLSNKALLQRVDALSRELQDLGIRRLACAMDNGLDWVILDLACQSAGVCFVPLPDFFSPAQIRHVADTAGIDFWVCQQALSGVENTTACAPLIQGYHSYRTTQMRKTPLPTGTQKITFTSGSTGQPKGVCLSARAQFEVARALSQVIALEAPVHLCLLPLSTLLENVAGVYAPLLCGGRVVLRDSSQRGLSGSNQLDVSAMTLCISEVQPNSLILVPELLQALLMAIDNGWQPPHSLKFVAVGGSKVAAGLIARARSAGLPVYQGYGLSEAASVVALSHPGSEPNESVGRVLPHLKLEMKQGEISVSGNSFLGYLGEPESWYPDCVNTGDLGELVGDELLIKGRKKNLLISSFGRNISPEWVESELMQTGLFAQSVVVGDARPYCTALLYPGSDEISEAEIAMTINDINQGLPDYAKLKNWYRLSTPLTVQNDLLTANGRPKREQIQAHYSTQIASMYTPLSHLSATGVVTMNFFEKLQQETQAERDYLLNAPVIHRCFDGDISVDDYVAFLQQAYHHVKHTVPLLMAVGSRLSEQQEWLREAVAEYIEEELGHQEWVLNDIAAAGFDKEAARRSVPNLATELMVSYAYDTIARHNPLCFFGMVHVLEGTSIALADKAAANIATAANLPRKAFSYLKSHGALDIEHVKFFESLMNKISDPKDQADIIHSAKVFYRLYGDIFYSLSPEHGLNALAEAS